MVCYNYLSAEKNILRKYKIKAVCLKNVKKFDLLVGFCIEMNTEICYNSTIEKNYNRVMGRELCHEP